MEKEINERFIRISSKLPFPKTLQTGDDLTLTVEGQNYILNCTKREEFDKQDGTVDWVYVLKSLLE